MTDQVNSRPTLLVSDFNLSTLHSMLSRAGLNDGLSFESGGFGEVAQPLLSETTSSEASRGAVVWTSPTGVLSNFERLLSGSLDSADSVMEEVDRFADLVASASERFRFILLVSWTVPPGHRGLGMLDLDPVRGVAATVLRANLRLSERMRGLRNVFLLDGARWVGGRQEAEEAARLWFLSKSSVTHATLEVATDEIIAAIRALRGQSKKVVVVDLDNTLWGGIVGDVGWESLRLGGHDPLGEAFVDFQKALKGLTNRGIVLGIVSKNEEEVALEAIRNHPEMILKVEDFAGWRINWRDKALNLTELIEELNVGIDSVVFIDDSASERGRVAEALPRVMVPDWPSDPLRYGARLRAMPNFDLPTLSEEDRLRTSSYTAERNRRESRATVSSTVDWLESLRLQVEVSPLNRADLPRATQLLNKTNQMNLTTRRLTESEFWEWSSIPGHKTYTFRVTDRFGDYGLTGLVSLDLTDGRDLKSHSSARIVDFVLSCRVFGRLIEQAMVHLAAEIARKEGKNRLEAHLISTSKNEPCRRFWEQESGFSEDPDTPRTFALDLAVGYPLPDVISLHLRHGKTP